jgi:hypothetical protein
MHPEPVTSLQKPSVYATYRVDRRSRILNPYLYVVYIHDPVHACSIATHFSFMYVLLHFFSFFFSPSFLRKIGSREKEEGGELEVGVFFILFTYIHSLRLSMSRDKRV